MGFLDEMKQAFKEGEDSSNKFFDKFEKKADKPTETANESEPASDPEKEKSKSIFLNDDESDNEPEYIDGSLMPDIKKLGGKLAGFIKKKLT
jgi:hypothetical protein